MTKADERAVMLVGGPDTGKTHFLLSLVSAIDRGRGSLSWVEQPEEIGYVEKNMAMVLKGEWAGHTSRGTNDFSGRVQARERPNEMPATVYVPDISGELWNEIISTREMEPSWLGRLSECSAALLFVRPFSKHFNAPLDWVTSADLLGVISQSDSVELPTQVSMCELLNFLSQSLRRTTTNARPRVAIIISAWDRLNTLDFPGPWEYLDKQLPMFSGALRDCRELEIMPFGCSAIGGDLKEDPEFNAALVASTTGVNGFVVFENPHNVEQIADVTIPLSWALGICDIGT